MTKEEQEYIAWMITDFPEEFFTFNEEGEMSIEDTEYYITIKKKKGYD